MTISVTFDSVTLPNPAPFKIEESANTFKIDIECFTDDYSDIDTIRAKIGVSKEYRLYSGKTKIQTTGTKSSLVISGVNADLDGTYTNCVIMEDMKENEVAGTAGIYWKFRLQIAQDTSA